jgi:hypothetical protein
LSPDGANAMANEAAEVDPEKLKAEMDKLSKEIEAMNAECDEICNDIKANAKVKDSIQKIVNKA